MQHTTEFPQCSLLDPRRGSSCASVLLLWGLRGGTGAHRARTRAQAPLPHRGGHHCSSHLHQIAATFIGYRAAGLSGTLGIFLVPWALAAAQQLQRWMQHTRLQGFGRGAAPAVVGLLAVTALTLAPSACTSWAIAKEVPIVCCIISSILPTPRFMWTPCRHQAKHTTISAHTCTTLTLLMHTEA